MRLNYLCFCCCLTHYSGFCEQQDFEQYLESIPDVEWDESEAAAKDVEKQRKWEGFARFCREKVTELEEVVEESETHRLHDQYSLNRLFQRFDGLYEEQWAKIQNAEMLDGDDPVSIPDNADEVFAALTAEIAERSGLEESDLRLTEDDVAKLPQ